MPAVGSFSGFVVGVGSMLYAFEGQAMVLPMENKMKEPTDMLGYNGVLSVSMTVVSCIYATTGSPPFPPFPGA